MFKLVVDTSIQGGFLGISESDSKIPGWISSVKESKASSLKLGSMFKQALQYYKCEPSDIDTILVSTGPGSFTGIKLGLSFCYGLHRSIPTSRLIGASSFELVVKKLSTIYENLLVITGSTKTQGFIHDGIKISNLKLTTDSDRTKIQKILDTKDLMIVSIGEWKEFDEMIKKTGTATSVAHLDTATLHHMSFEAFCNYDITNINNNTLDSLPKPTYYREPSVFGN